MKKFFKKFKKNCSHKWYYLKIFHQIPNGIWNTRQTKFLSAHWFKHHTQHDHAQAKRDKYCKLWFHFTIQIDKFITQKWRISKRSSIYKAKIIIIKLILSSNVISYLQFMRQKLSSLSWSPLQMLYRCNFMTVTISANPLINQSPNWRVVSKNVFLVNNFFQRWAL